MITKWLGTLSNVQLYLVVGALSLVCLGGTFGAGYLMGGRSEARHQTKEVLKTVYVPVKEIQQVQVRNIEREQQLQASLEQSRQSLAGLRAQLDRVPRNDCVVNPSAVGLLNEAVTGNPQADSPGVDVNQSTTVTNLTDWALTAISQYNDLATRHNALVDWAQEELIEPQRLEQ